ncbi:hypothetical protein PHJA_000778300 [Phtheirospermum japonicum]|uniref:Bifunctional inhibitor/plant lipid transfer protein/seed storage helical domain-containing protein n=1 Tax=Phtheirospermum japonicum TaxID=374723 RepID=A0A830BRF9_9LAMI|nr:hypothetical protein PHJA_000778300 [Phtheirospermum japonicum]
MEISVKCFCIMGLLVAIYGPVSFADNACPGSSPDQEAIKLVPCADAAKNQNAKVTAGCCKAVAQLGKNPACLCAVMLSDLAKSSGVKPDVALTIPKRCNLVNRPVGYKCGGN